MRNLVQFSNLPHKYPEAQKNPDLYRKLWIVKIPGNFADS